MRISKVMSTDATSSHLVICALVMNLKVWKDIPGGFSGSVSLLLVHFRFLGTSDVVGLGDLTFSKSSATTVS